MEVRRDRYASTYCLKEKQSGIWSQKFKRYPLNYSIKIIRDIKCINYNHKLLTHNPEPQFWHWERKHKKLARCLTSRGQYRQILKFTWMNKRLKHDPFDSISIDFGLFETLKQGTIRIGRHEKAPCVRMGKLSTSIKRCQCSHTALPWQRGTNAAWCANDVTNSKSEKFKHIEIWLNTSRQWQPVV